MSLESFFEALDLHAIGFAFAFSAVFVGALVQGGLGFGLNLITVPVVAAIRPEALPAAAIILALPMTLGSALREHAHIDYAAVLWTTLGRMPGVVVGAWIVSVLAKDALAAVIGAIVVLAVAISVAAPRIPINRGSQAVVGLLGGLMGTASSIGGPPMALLYQDEPGPIMRSTLGATFLVGTALSLAALAIAGEVSSYHFLFGGSMVPAVLLGLFASRYLHGWLDAGWLRPCVLAFSALAGIGVILHGVLPT
jgi:uncharacterized membrane protein YfcA